MEKQYIFCKPSLKAGWMSIPSERITPPLPGSPLRWRPNGRNNKAVSILKSINNKTINQNKEDIQMSKIKKMLIVAALAVLIIVTQGTLFASAAPVSKTTTKQTVGANKYWYCSSMSGNYLYYCTSGNFCYGSYRTQVNCSMTCHQGSLRSYANCPQTYFNPNDVEER